MFTRPAMPALAMLVALAAGAAPAQTATVPPDSTPPAGSGPEPRSIQSAAELLVADEAALACHREASASEPNPEPCDVFLKLTAASTGEARRQAAAHNNRGLIMARLGGLEAALADFEAALALAPTSRAAEVNRGTVLFQMGLYPDALNAFETVIAHDDEHRAAALFNRSFVYRALGELDLAAADLASAAEMDRALQEGRQPIGAPAPVTAGAGVRPAGFADQTPE